MIQAVTGCTAGIKQTNAMLWGVIHEQLTAVSTHHASACCWLSQDIEGTADLAFVEVLEMQQPSD